MKPLAFAATACAAASLAFAVATTAAYSAEASGNAAHPTAQHKRVTPPPRPPVVTEISPGMPELDKRNAEREHGMDRNFNASKHRRADGSYQRD